MPIYVQFSKPSSGPAIVGGSQDAAHPHWVEVDAVSWGVRAAPSTKGASGVSPAPMADADMHFTTADGTAFTNMMRGTVSGPHYPTVIVEFVNSDRTYLRLELTDVLITSCSIGGGARTDTPMMQFALNAKTATFKYLDVSPGAPKPAPPKQVQKTK